MSLLNINWHQL